MGTKEDTCEVKLIGDIIFVFILILGILAMLSMIASFILGCSAYQAEPHGPEPMISCDRADDRIRELGCYDTFTDASMGDITASEDDLSWLAHCAAIQEPGVIIIDTDCIIAAITCDELEGCL